MATGYRKTSVTNSLVQSSIFSTLNIIPEPDNGAVATAMSSSTSEQEAYPIKPNRRERTSQTRLNFLSKSGAGSASSGRQASIESTASSVGSLISPMSGDLKKTIGLQSRDSLVSLPGGDFGDTGSRTTRILSQETAALVNQPISWEENADSSCHIWHEHDTREACYLSDSQYCQHLKAFHPRRTKLRCSACKVVAHTTCIKQLHSDGIYCKYTFREIRQKVRDSVKNHHFLNRRKAVGRCKKCEKGFGSWKKLTGREFIGVSCSWCGDSYCMICFDNRLRKEPCHMGPLRNLIIPPSWIVRTPPELQTPQASPHLSELTSPKNSRRKTRRSRRRKIDERASKNFIVKSFVANHKPLLVFINPKSGGKQGAKLLHTFQWLLNPRQVFDLSQGGPKFGLQFFRGVSNLRVLACGGDGTAGWVLSILDQMDIQPSLPLGILPLGTGNDLARVLKWGGGYTDEPIDKILKHVEEGPVVEMDRWHLGVWPNPNLPPEQMVDTDAVGDVPLHVINNYFSIGADAHVVLEFHLEREANPEKLNSRLKNKVFYTKRGGRDVFLRRFHNMTDHIQLWGDGEDLTPKIRALKLEAICLLNIPSYSAGTNPWGTPPFRDQRIEAQKMDDGRIEVLGFWAATLAKLHIGLAHGERLAQCQHVKIMTTKALPVQIDGEACKLLPSAIEVVLKNKVPMVTKARRKLNVDTPLQGVVDRIKLSVSKVTSEQYDRFRSDVPELKRIAKSVGIVHGSPRDCLRTVRAEVNLFTNDLNEDGEEELAKNWRFLDIAMTGRVERMFQVLPDQEEAMYIGDMFSDGLFVVELSSQSPMTSTDPNPTILLSPDMEQARCLESAEDKRKAFGRNPSYELATEEQRVSSRSPSNSPVRIPAAALEVPVSNDIPSTSSEGTPAPSDDELGILRCTIVPDTDSGETDAHAYGPSSVQKALFDAVKRGKIAEVEEHHGKGAKLTATDSNGWTPLHHAARLEKKEAVQYIVDNVSKASLDIAEDEKNQTALHKAAWFGYVDICRILVEAGASLNRRDYQGNTPYDKAVQSGDAELKMYLKRKESEQKWNVDEVAI
ncbi:diacylglycerol kinase zeta-like isoform X2 [Halichondria panicea]|uniref:diacylglycerol kinase zeta-like isoform X2 n=1 Tax=Halichondria panicea TaxID=6063 RepID=UPI00312BBC52